MEGKMKAEVIYCSRKGATAKIGKALGEGIGIKAVSIDEFKDFDKDIDILFIGGAKYFGSIDKNLEAFIKKLNRDKIKMACVYSTNFNDKDAFKLIKEAIEQAGIPVIEEHFHSLSKFLSAAKGHPDAQDEENARKFSAKVISLYFRGDEKKEEEK